MGCKLASEQWELTPIQRFVYIMAKDAHTPDELKETSPNVRRENDLINQI